MRACNQDVMNSDEISVGLRKRKNKEQLQLFMNEKDFRTRLQEVTYTPEFIFTKIFRKDGPPLGDRFDSLPENAFPCGSKKGHHDGGLQAYKRRKGFAVAILDYETCCENNSPALRHGVGKGPMLAEDVPFSKHGMGKGLMTKKGAIGKNHGIGKGLMTAPVEVLCGANGSKTAIQKKTRRVQPRESVMRKLANREQARRKASLRRRKVVVCRKVQTQTEPCTGKCELALGEAKSLEYTQQSTTLVDDEELELRELQAGPNPLASCSHFPTNGSHACSLCKDLLAKFPPLSVAMKRPFSAQPWASVQGLVNKLFKAYHFLCTYAATIRVYSFTLDEFARAFHDQDSLLLGHIHLILLKQLLSDIGKELSRGLFAHASKNCKFLYLIQSLEHRGFIIEFWEKSLNPMTWKEILCQILVAAGFGSKHGMGQKEACKKEVNLMEKYGVSPGTLKGELFSILLSEGNNGMKVSDLAKSSPIVQLSFTDTLPTLENLITSCLSGDITLFEKISSSGYRLRIHTAEQECDECQSESEDFGSMDEISDITGGIDASDSEHDSRDSSTSQVDCSNSSTNILSSYNEIDESHPGDVWLSALMEGEYSDLSIEEKLNVLNSLIDLLSAGSSIRKEDTMVSTAECYPNKYYGSGAKIKRSMTKQSASASVVQSGSYCGEALSGLLANTLEQPIDSLFAMSRISEEEKHANMKMIAEQMEREHFIHPMQSFFLGSDRRFNRYWLFLGPCSDSDPGHRRIYFESSDDGHWEMIDSEQALNALLLALDCRGVREASLLASLEKRAAILSQSMSRMTIGSGNKFPYMDQSESNTSRESSSSPVSDIDNHFNMNEMQNEIPSSYGAAAVEAGGVKGEDLAGKSCDYKAFDSWIWKSFYSELISVKNGNKAHLNSLRRCDQCHDLYWRDVKHCRICHTTFELDFDLEEKYAVHSAVCQANNDSNRHRKKKALSSQLQALKAAMYAIESATPEDALLNSWKRRSHNLWVNRLRRVSSLREFLKVLADFVTAINEEWFYQNNVACSYFAAGEVISNFSTMPQTYSAAALWLVKLDLLFASAAERTEC